MNPDRQSGDQAGSATGLIRYRDICQFAASFAGTWDLEYQQLGAADRSGWCRYTKAGSGLVYEEEIAATTGFRGALSDGLLAVHLTDDRGRSGRWQGDQAPPNAFAYGDPGMEIDVVMPRGTRNVVAVLPLVKTLERIERLTDAPPSKALPSGDLFRPLDPASHNRLVSELRMLLREPPTGEGLGMKVVESIVRALDGVEDLAGAPTKAARRLFRRAMEHCHSGDLIVSPAQLALDLEVSLRSLEMAFRYCMDVPPARYLRVLRLNRVHERLLAIDSGDGFVGPVALDFGFYQTGRFAAEYRELFGELPSETLKRRRAKRRARLPRLG